MRLSVIVASHDSEAALERCLEALAGQECDVVVSDASKADLRSTLGAQYPNVAWVRGRASTLPELYWRALDHVTGDVVGLLEARAVPDSSWAAAMLREHCRHPDIDAVGGPVRLRREARSLDGAYYFTEFVRYAPPAATRRCSSVSDANVSYKRDFLERHRVLLEPTTWPNALHARVPTALSMAADATIEYVPPERLAAAAAQRFANGRGHAATRVAQHRLIGRIPYAAFTPALPALLLLRQARDARRAGLSSEFWRRLPATLALNAAWSAGEFSGYLTGAAGDTRLR